MWARRTRQGKKQNDEGGEEENIIEVHGDEGVMVYRPSSSVMPARPLGVPLEMPIIAPVVKKEIKEEAEAESSHLSVLDENLESDLNNISLLIDFPTSDTFTKNTPDENVPKIKIKTELLGDVSDDAESALNNDVESSQIISTQNMRTSENEKNTTEINQKSIECCNDGFKVEKLEKNMPSKKSLALWDLQSMFTEVSSKNIDQPAANMDDRASDNQIAPFQPFNNNYVHLCLNELNRRDVEECLEYLNSSFPTIKKNPLFCLEVPAKKKLNSIAVHSASTESMPPDKCDISTEALKKILEVTNSQSISHDLPTQSNAQLFQSDAPRIPKSDCSGLKETINIKKEPVSPKSKPSSHLVNDTKEDASIKSKTVVPKIHSMNQAVSSKIFSGTPKEISKKRKNSEDAYLNVKMKKEKNISPEKHKSFDNCGENPKESKKSFETDLNVTNKNIKEILASVPVENLASVIRVEKSNSASCNLNSDDKSVIYSTIEAARFKQTKNVVTEKQTVQERKIYRNLDSSLSKSKTTQQDNRTDVTHVSFLPGNKNTSSLICQSDSTTSVRPISVIDRFNDVDLNAPKKHIEKKAVQENKNTSSLICQSDSTTSLRPISVIDGFNNVDLNAPKKHIGKKAIPSAENFACIGSVDNISASNTNLDLSPRGTNKRKQISYDLDNSLSKSKTTQRDNKMEISRVSSLPISENTPSAIPRSESTTSVGRIPVVDRFLPANNAHAPTMVQSPYNTLQENSCYEAPQKKRKLTAQEYLQRKSYSNISKRSSLQNSSINLSNQMSQMYNIRSSSQNSSINLSDQMSQMYNIRSSSQNSSINLSNQMSQMYNSTESRIRDPRLQNNVPGSPSILSLSSSPNQQILTNPNQNVYTYNSNPSHTDFQNSVPDCREKLYSQELKEPPKAQQISECEKTQITNKFESRRGSNSSIMKLMREKIGRRFVEPSDVTVLILEWNVSWLEQQKHTSVVPPIIHDAFSYPKVNHTYESVLSYYNTYLPLHLLNIWMSMYESWKRNENLPETFFQSRVEKSTYVKISCSMQLNPANKLDWPKTEDLVICHGKNHKKLFGKVVSVSTFPNSPLNDLGSILVDLDIICAEKLDATSGGKIKLQKLINLRIALNICQALKDINSVMHFAILNPRKQSSHIKIIHAQKFCSAYLKKNNLQDIMRSANSRSHCITLVHTVNPSDSLKAITLIVPEVVSVGGLIFLCMKEEETFFQIATDLVQHNPVLAIKEEDVPRLPRQLAAYTIKNIRQKDLEQCHVVLTLVSAMFIGELETRLQKYSKEEGKNAMCLIHEAQYFLETETALLLEHNFKSLILLGRKGAVNLEAILQRQSFNTSLFNRIYCECET